MALTLASASVSAAGVQTNRVTPALMPVCGGGDGGGGIDPDSMSVNSIHSKPARVRQNAGVVPTDVSANVIGHDADSIHKQFASVIEANLSGADVEQRLNRLSDKELSALARHYKAVSGEKGTPLLRTFASRLSDTALLRVSVAFGKEATSEAVQTYSSRPVRESFIAKASNISPDILPGGNDPGGNGGGRGVPGTGAGPAPSSDMTLEEIYLDYRTAPVGSLSPASALSETAMFASQRVFWSATAGTAIGTGINYLITNYDPTLGDAIGGTIAGSIQAAELAATEVERGHYQSSYDALFGYPVTDQSGVTVQFDSDWNVAEPMEEYYDDGGGCGW